MVICNVKSRKKSVPDYTVLSDIEHRLQFPSCQVVEPVLAKVLKGKRFGLWNCLLRWHGYGDETVQ
eukprot:4721711-Amphidinium_carterae.1